MVGRYNHGFVIYGADDQVTSCQLFCSFWGFVGCQHQMECCRRRALNFCGCSLVTELGYWDFVIMMSPLSYPGVRVLGICQTVINYVVSERKILS